MAYGSPTHALDTWAATGRANASKTATSALMRPKEKGRQMILAALKFQRSVCVLVAEAHSFPLLDFLRLFAKRVRLLDERLLLGGILLQVRLQPEQ